ncbi:adenosylcobinamide-GDP ribazoletransferase [Thetidibacter halocola]|uniref:Adenosylcobinamide-GDP ribazoletransferase n=1 Tax=Thetidibacter halocola TaxID=2827239 RepID=A0A8J7WCV8_9RHOB|nr:adenosylcobinamide-GDP ribazoletransferase [Thetidibacter halocola]MBS0122889.1 adenosylcobinamide-GDP ribazoletransferase [Thetidibacter halocola]
MRSDPRLEWQLFLLAVQLLTRLPVPRNLPWSDDLAVRATKYYPAVGLVVGGIGAAVLWAAQPFFPAPLPVLLSLAATLLVTGAFHEDGLADMADGIGGGADRERALEIMRDSRIGSYGAITLGLSLAVKVAALSALPPWIAGWALVGGHVLGRMASVHIIATTDYARPKGTKFPAPSVTPDGYRWALVTTLLMLIGLVAVLGPGPTSMAVLGSIALGQAVRTLFVARLGGYTGDCLGAEQQMAELGVYLGILLWL